MTFHVPEKHRVKRGPMGSNARYGNNGAFFVPNKLRAKAGEPPLAVIASDGGGWEHVSVSLPHRCPTWPEMAYVKGLFWDDGDCVLQFHPPQSEYVNNHQFCLHMWRPTHAIVPMPPSLMVGYRDLSPDDVAAMSSRERLQLMDDAADVVVRNDLPGAASA
jgi:hypothetical protein